MVHYNHTRRSAAKAAFRLEVRMKRLDHSFMKSDNKDPIASDVGLALDLGFEESCGTDFRPSRRYKMACFISSSVGGFVDPGNERCLKSFRKDVCSGLSIRITSVKEFKNTLAKELLIRAVRHSALGRREQVRR